VHADMSWEMASEGLSDRTASVLSKRVRRSPNLGGEAVEPAPF
jgi:hypothetical protein